MVLVSFGNSDITSEEIIYVVFLGEREEDIMKKKIITALWRKFRQNKHF